MRSAAPAAAVDHVAGDDRAVGGGDLAGAVARAVVDDQDRGLDPADLGGDPVEDRADVVGLVVGGDEDADLVAEALRMAGDAELLPGEALEHRRELAGDPRALAQRPQHEQEEDQDREHGDADDPGPVLALERERREQRVGDLGRGDDQDPERDREQDEDVGVAQLAPAPDRIAADQQRDDDADGADRGQLGRQDVGRMRHRAGRG